MGNHKVISNVIIDNHIIDIWNEKFVANVYISGKALEEHAIKLLQSFTVANNESKSITHAAAIYLLQQKIFIFDLSQWDTSNFYKQMELERLWEVLDKESVPNPLGYAICSGEYNHPLGREIFNISSTSFINTPYQIYLCDPRSKALVTGTESFELKIMQLKQKCFVHAPYIYNMCKNESWIHEGLRSQLEAAVKIKSSGVVVHLGSYVGQDINVALEKQKENIRRLLPYVTEKTPLILETSAGEGNDTCCSPDELLNLVREINDRRLKLCVDTCHVFSAGYDPAWFLEQVLDYTILVHYNDSAGSRGCCRDRHAPAGTGCIGVKRMLMVKAICINKNIPMIVE